MSNNICSILNFQNLKISNGHRAHCFIQMSKFYDVPVSFVTPTIFLGCVLFYLRSLKGGYYSISEDFSCFCHRLVFTDFHFGTCFCWRYL